MLEPLWFRDEEVVPENMVDMVIDCVSNEDVSDHEDKDFPLQDLDSFSNQIESETSGDSETEYSSSCVKSGDQNLCLA